MEQSLLKYIHSEYDDLIDQMKYTFLNFSEIQISLMKVYYKWRSLALNTHEVGYISPSDISLCCYVPFSTMSDRNLSLEIVADLWKRRTILFWILNIPHWIVCLNTRLALGTTIWGCCGASRRRSLIGGCAARLASYLLSPDCRYTMTKQPPASAANSSLPR